MKQRGIIKELSRDERGYYVAKDVMELLGVGKSKAYSMIRALRKELVDKGKLTDSYPPGKVPKNYFNDRCML